MIGYSCRRDKEDARARLRAFWAGSSLDGPSLYVAVASAAQAPSFAAETLAMASIEAIAKIC